MTKPRCITCGNAPPCSCPTIGELIERSSIGQALADIKERGIDAHLADLEREMPPHRRRSRRG